MEEGVVLKDIDFDASKVKIVGIDEIRPNTWNPKNLDTKEYKRVKSSVEKNGLRLPIVVRQHEGYQIIDGEQRWRSCKDLGYKKVVIYDEGEMSDQRAKELTIWYQQQVPFNEVKLAWLIKDLVGMEDVNIPYSQEEVDAYLKATEFDPNSFKPNTLPDDTGSLLTFTIKVSKSQLEVVRQAMDKFIEKNATPEMGISQPEAFVNIMGWYRRQDGGN